jgi:hypothetical protein
MHLMVGNHADPTYEICAQLKRFVLAPKHHANFLENLFRVCRIPKERDEIGKQPAIMLREEARKSRPTFRLRQIRVAAILPHKTRPKEASCPNRTFQTSLLVAAVEVLVLKTDPIMKFS